MSPPANAGAESTDPQSMSMLGLVHKFKRVHDTMPDRSFCFILGAGASVTSKIKSAGGMVEEWIETLYREATGRTGEVPIGWATDKTLGITGFNPKEPAGSYSALYRRMYQHDPNAGYAYLEDQMSKAEPSFGYSVLGQILDRTRHRVVITVNFDNLVADSVSLFSATYPLVCGHELLAPYVTDKLRRPLVLKVHRDLLLAPMSVPEEIQKIDQGFYNAIGRLLKNYTPIVIGYGGNDGSLMRCLEELPEASVPGGIYWCYRDDSPPPERIKKVVARQKGHLVGIMGFDELLMQFGNELKYEVADQYVLNRAKERSERIVKQAQELQERIRKRNEEVQHLAAAATPQSVVSAKDETAAVTSAMSSTMQRKDTTKRWWQWENEARAATDLAERDAIYRKALEQLPHSPEMLGNYASFLKNVRKDFDTAEAMYKQVLETDPKRANTLTNYALFLADIRKDYNTAEAMYKQVLETHPKRANTLGNLAKLYFDTGRVTDGLTKVDEAIANLGNEGTPRLYVECWMYAYCVWSESKQAEALSHLKTMLLQTEIRTGDWDFSGVIALAKSQNHPESKWLDKLAEVVSGRAAPASLSRWPAWKKAVVGG